MLEAELAHRDATKRARLLRQARLPVHKSAEGFDWSHVRFSEGWGRDDMLSLGFVGPREDLVFFGKTGRGKTHMAVPWRCARPPPSGRRRTPRPTG